MRELARHDDGPRWARYATARAVPRTARVSTCGNVPGRRDLCRHPRILDVHRTRRVIRYSSVSQIGVFYHSRGALPGRDVLQVAGRRPANHQRTPFYSSTLPQTTYL